MQDILKWDKYEDVDIYGILNSDYMQVELKKGDWKMESVSSLKEHLRQLEEKLLQPEIRTSKINKVTCG